MLAGKRTVIRPGAALMAVLVCIGVLSGCGGNSGSSEGGKTAKPAEKTEWKASEAEMKKAEEIAAETELSVGCWIPPRMHQMRDDESAVARLQELKDSGINFIATHHDDLSSMKFIYRVLDAAEKVGIKVVIELNTDLSEGGISRNLNVVKKTVDYPALAGYNLYDEPAEWCFEGLTEEFAKIKELAEGKNKVVYINMLPNYGPIDIMAPVVTEGLTAYQTYLESGLKAGTEALSFDFYPFYSGGSDEGPICRMLDNLSDMVFMAKKYSVPCWAFIQNSSWPGMREPDAAELLFLSGIHLAFGFKNYSYFLYADPYKGSEFNGMLTWDGELTPQYARVQANNAAVSGYKGRFLNYDLDGFYTDRLEGSYGDHILEELKLPMADDSVLRSIDADRSLLTGVFKKAAGADQGANDAADTAYFLLNFDPWNANTVTLNFSGSTPYTVWTAEGIAAMGEETTVSFSVPAYGFAFVELKAYT